MPPTVFISYDHDDASQVHGFRGLVANPNHPVTFTDGSLARPVINSAGQTISYPPTNPSAEKVRQAIRACFDQCSRMVVLIGDDTHSSTWVNWEIEEFYDRKRGGGDASRRICGLRLRGSRGGGPRALQGRSAGIFEWDLDALGRWLARPV